MNWNRRLFCAIAAACAVLSCNPADEPSNPPEGTNETDSHSTSHAKAPPSGEPATAVSIPVSIKTEHDAIHATLVEATQAPGRVGEAAKALADVLHPHFLREEEIALPPLGLLEPLAMNRPIDKAASAEAIRMSETLRAELPKMLEEHKAIRAAVQKLGEAARAEKAAKFERLAEDLALHAQNEEEVMYPSAVLVGELLRGRPSEP